MLSVLYMISMAVVHTNDANAISVRKQSA